MRFTFCRAQRLFLAQTITAGAFLVVAGCGSDRPEPAAQSVSPGAGTVQPRTTETAPQAEINEAAMPLVVFLGDSVCAGYGLDPEAAFPAILRRRLADAGSPFRLVNAGVSGDTTAGGLSRLAWLLKQKPDVLVVELGANDALRGRPLTLVEENLRRIIDRALKSSCRVLLLGMRIPPSYGPEYTEGFAALYERLGALENVAYVPFFMNGVGGVPELNLPDGIHPTARGHEKLADNVEPALRALLGHTGS